MEPPQNVALWLVVEEGVDEGAGERIIVSWDTRHVFMPRIFRNVSLSSALYKCYKGVDPFT